MGQWAYGSTQFRKDLALLRRHLAHFPFEKLVTHRFTLEQSLLAMETVKSEACMKAVFTPQG